MFSPNPYDISAGSIKIKCSFGRLKVLVIQFVSHNIGRNNLGHNKISMLCQISEVGVLNSFLENSNRIEYVCNEKKDIWLPDHLDS